MCVCTQEVKAKFKPGDVFVNINGTPVHTVAEVMSCLAVVEEGAELTITVKRALQQDTYFQSQVK